MSDMIDKAEALAPCPFCGEVPEIKERGENIALFVCASPPCKGSSMFMGFAREDREKAIAAWNRRAAPAVKVRVKPLVWRDEFMRWSGNSFTSTAVGAGHTYIIAASLYDPEADNVIAAKKAAAQADYEARIRAALEPVAAPDPVALLRDVPRYEPDNPLDNAPSMKADPQGDWLREADVLAALSRAIIQKGAAK